MMPILIFVVPFCFYDSGALGPPSQDPQKVTIEVFGEGGVLLDSPLFGLNHFQRVNCDLGYTSSGKEGLLKQGVLGEGCPSQ